MPVGANMNGPDWVWNDPTIGTSNYAQAWGWNTIRLNSCFAGGCPTGGGWDWKVNNNLDGIISEYTAKKIVVMISLHQFTGANVLSASEQAQVQAWWKDLANRYKSNPYVWYNILNEPTEDNNLTNWQNDYQPTIGVIRDTGANNMIVVDGSAYGQDIYDWTCTNLPYGNSAIINRVPALEATYHNILPSVHVYSDWGGGTSNCTQSQLDNRLAAYIQKVHSVNLPLVIGETGDQPGGPSRDVGNFRGQYVATQAAFDVAPTQGVGILWWHSSSGSGALLANSVLGWRGINSLTAPTNLTTFGRLLWNLGH